ncbi:MAG: alanine racemase [Nocardioidaceae bacterium]|nr:alanine racemase [Nocardioidaceae bacterium]
MPVSLYVDGSRWRQHLRAAAAAYPGIVPVAKGNGYGFTVGRLARRAQWLGADTLAVGTYAEVDDVRQRFSGDVLVMEPWRPSRPDIPYDSRLVHTVGRLEDLAALGDRGDHPRVVIEALTSMHRHGLSADALASVGRSPYGVRLEGHALHLPLGTGHVSEVEHWLARCPADRWYVSHLSDTELAMMRDVHRDIDVRPRVGTSLWLGDRGALDVRATVLDAHPVRRGERVGYRQRRLPRSGTVLVVSGGTAHGIGLQAPPAAATARQRAAAVAQGGLDAVGRALSPYVVDGRQRWFVEPPHMQVSMIFLPVGCAVPRVGDEVELQVRFTTTAFDAIHIS